MILPVSQIIFWQFWRFFTEISREFLIITRKTVAKQLHFVSGLISQRLIQNGSLTWLTLVFLILLSTTFALFLEGKLFPIYKFMV